MLDYKGYLEQVINRRGYVLSSIEEKINRLYIDDLLSEQDRDELLAMAAENARNDLQIDVAAKLADIERRLQALENPPEGPEEPQYAVWVSGYATKQGETVLRDLDGDGVYELCRYDGGRASTTLDVGRIDGWHLVDGEGNILGTIVKDKGSGVFTVEPIATEEPETEGEGE